jgi:thiosulfate/3-mercaptopyruvate sulfurtransferase
MDELPRFEILISTDQLKAHLDNSDWIIVDCRFDLSKPEWGFSDYQQGHIRGAVYAHLDFDLSGPLSPSLGRHPLPEPQTFCDTLARLGI